MVTRGRRGCVHVGEWGKASWRFREGYHNAPFYTVDDVLTEKRDKNVVFSKVSFSLHNVTTRVTSPEKGIHDERHPRNLCQQRVVSKLGTIGILVAWGP